jgi:hypothetical protein
VSAIANHLPLIAMFVLIVMAAAGAILYILKHGNRVQAALVTVSVCA